ncbi:hypothetical protein MXD81_54745, partial [Microbacteriaceae bacterium K1510]|nr:hypothetical protein [Microbacteriaceae bacterium K1510]
KPEQDGCLLEFTHSFKVPGRISWMMAGWHVHIELLAETLTEAQVEWPWKRWEEMREKYAEALGSLEEP